MTARARAVVTGAAVRVGRAIALELAGSGFDLVLHHRSNPDEAERTRADCEARGALTTVVAADLGTPAGCDAVVAAVTARWDGLHLLVNNASVFYPMPFAQIDADEWDRVLAVNTRAPFLLSRGLLPLLRAADGDLVGAPAGQHGVVVHLVDIGAERPVSGHAHYSVSKAGVAMLVKAMAVELAPAVRTVGISPGQVMWPDEYNQATRERLARRIPLGRAGEPEDVARLVRFMVREGHYLNGVIVAVDGGLGDPVLMDELTLTVDLSCLVGILPRERVEPQPIRVAVTLELELEPVGVSGDLARGVDYAEVDAMVRFLAVEGQFRLIESLAVAILQVVLRDPVRRAAVRIEKPTVMRAALPAVALLREASWAGADEVVVDLPEVEVRRSREPAAGADAVGQYGGFALSVSRRPW